MALLQSLITRKKQSCHLHSEQVTLAKLKQLIPIRNLSEEKLQTFALNNQSEVYPAGEILFNINDAIDSSIYLLRGTVILTDADGKFIEVEASGVKAKFPLTSGIKNTTTATAKSDISILRVSHKIMSMNSKKKAIHELTIPEQLAHNGLLQNFAHHFIEDDIEVPSLPVIAMRLRQAMQKDIGIAEAVEIIQLDPVISAKLIEVANCPLYHTANPANTLLEAVKRIGLNATRSLVISLSIKNVFTSTTVQLNKYLNHLWKNSLHLSCLCYELALFSKQRNPEEALLAGLVCDIGTVPFLHFVSKLPAKYYTGDEVKEAIPVVRGTVGASLLSQWGFAEEFIQVPLASEDWHHSNQDTLTYSDIVILSKLHSKIGRSEKTDLPIITSIPAASKLHKATLSPEDSLSILHDAKDKINSTMRVLAG